MNKGRAPILIIFPPHSGHLFYPCLSLPSLTAYLRANDHEVVQLDWGLETFDRMLSREFLSDIRRRNETAIRSLSGKKRKSTADSRRLRALERANTGAEPVIEAIDDVKDILRDGKRFYEPRSYSFASGVITEALKIVSAGFHPTSILENRLVTSGGLTLDTISHLSIDPETNPFLDILENLVDTARMLYRPTFLGISVNYYSQVVGGFTAARLFKRGDPRIHVCMGGAVVSEGRRQIVHDRRYFDFCDSYVFGEGETALEYLVSIHDDPDGTLTDRPNNILLREDLEKGTVYAGLDFEMEADVDIDSLPTPDFTGLPLDRYLSPHIAFPITCSRGCYWRRCSFCSISVSSCSLFKARDIALVKGDVETLIKKHGARYFFFNDNAIPPRYLSELAEFFGSFDTGIAWTGMVRQEKELTHTLLERIKDGGCLQLHIGQESANERMINLMRKGISLANSEKIIRNAAAAEIAVSLMNIIGFPTETAAEADQTVQFLLNNKKYLYSAYVSPFIVRENSPVHGQPADFCIQYLRIKNRNDLRPLFYFSVNGGMSRKEAKAKYLDAKNVLFRAYPWSGLFLDEGVHSLLYLSHYGYRGFKEMLESLLLHFFLAAREYPQSS